MRKISDLAKEDPVALTTAVQVTANVLGLVIHVNPDLVVGFNLVLCAWWAVVRWLVVSPATHQRVVEGVRKASVVRGRMEATADLEELAKAKRKPPTPRKAGAAKKVKPA